MGRSDVWVRLLNAASVPISRGTAFLIAPGLLATCAHVVPDVGGVADVDLAFLAAPDGLDDPVLTSPVLELGDELWTYGYPEAARAGQPATFVYQGVSGNGMLRGYGVPVGPGYSGSPVVNLRTGAVCGMLATSDLAGSAHLVPVSDILRHCPIPPGPNHEWLRALTDQQLAAGQWAFPGPTLRRYLEAAAVAADTHPYVGATHERRPSLSRVYVRRSSEGGHRPPRPADDILRMKRDLLLVGVAGAGKSSLLRMGTAGLAHEWLDGTGRDVPVLVRAADLLARAPFAVLLHTAVQAGLAAHLLDPLPADLFSGPPLPGARWLVLVDGLDEVDDREDRRRVADLLVSHRSGPYRFVIATRPLSEPERADLRLRAFELQQFTYDELRDCAEGWCAAAGREDPSACARDYMNQMERAGMSGLARLPLMASLTCQLYLEGPAEGLPTSRYEIYEQFVYLMRSRDPGSEVFDLLPRLAWTQRDGAARPAVDLVDEWLAGPRTDHTPGRIRVQQIKEGLRSTGLLYETADDFMFVHDTFVDFLAARHAAGDPTLSDAHIRGLDLPYERAIFPHPISMFRHFLIGSLSARPAARPKLLVRLRHLAARRYLYGVQFIAELVKEGTVTDPGVISAAVGRAVRVVAQRRRRFIDRMNAALLLHELGDPRGADHMALLAAGDEGEPRWRDHAAQLLTQMDDPRGRTIRADLAYSIAMDPQVVWQQRTRYADLLGPLDDPRHVELLVMLSTDETLDGYGRGHALRRLQDVDIERVAEIARSSISDQTRVAAARCLAWRRSDLACELLVAMMRDPAGTLDLTCTAAIELAALDGPAGRAALREAVVDPLLAPSKRAFVNEVLKQNGEQTLSEDELNELNLELVREATLEAEYRGEAAGDCPPDRLVALLDDPTADVLTRFYAYEGLLMQRDARAASYLQPLIKSVTAPEVDYQTAATLAANFERIAKKKNRALRLALLIRRLSRV